MLQSEFFLSSATSSGVRLGRDLLFDLSRDPGFEDLRSFPEELRWDVAGFVVHWRPRVKGLSFLAVTVRTS